MMRDWKRNYNAVTMEEAKKMLSGGASWFEIIPGYIGLVWPTMRVWSLDAEGELGEREVTKDYQHKHSKPDPVADLRSDLYDTIARAKRDRGELQEAQDKIQKLEAAYSALGGDPAAIEVASKYYDE